MSLMIDKLAWLAHTASICFMITGQQRLQPYGHESFL